ncbi:acyltransferase family protein [Spirosoma sp. KUDC1026]|uniref:acyltransferase family protein n=1 Tax=Spirosoma sp. KUDC1026 TaxID=2745947 RepID=UPI00159BCE7F|nr:acyltransferase [Spirosoma sp. KUDC1026]QKZ14395.1 acyltransferase [Spirosoma sp. KUDC1026]
MYFPQLTFLRYIAAAIVLMSHFGQVQEILSIPGLGNAMHYSNTLLSFFFVLTGFVLILSINQNNQLPPAIPPKLLLFRRLIRIYPLHWLALLLTLVMQQIELVQNPTADVAPVDTGKVLAHALLLQAWYPEYSFALVYNYVSWTLCVELLLTLLAPFLYSWMLKQPTTRLVRNVTLVWLGSLLVHYQCLQQGMPVDWGFFWPPVHVPEFIVGMAGGFVLCRRFEVLKQQAKWMHGLAYLSGALMIGLMMGAFPYLYKNSLIFAPTYLFVLLSVSLSSNWVTKLFCTKPFLYLGKISYGVYILQLPVAIFILRVVHPWAGWPYRYSVLLFLVTLTGVAALAYEWMEKPIATYVKNRLLRKVTSVPLVEPSPSLVAQ